jgi:DNA primase
LVLALLNHHWLLEEFPEQIAALSLASKPLIKLRDALLEVQARNTPLDTAGIRAQLTDLGLDRLVSMTERAITHKSDRFAAPDAERHTVENGWHHAMALHERQVGLRRALEAAEQAFLTDQSEEALARITEIQRLLAQSMTIEEAGAA